MNSKSLEQLILVSHRTEASITDCLSHLSNLHALDPGPMVGVEAGHTRPWSPSVTLVTTLATTLGAGTAGPRARFTVTPTLATGHGSL